VIGVGKKLNIDFTAIEFPLSNVLPKGFAKPGLIVVKKAQEGKSK